MPPRIATQTLGCKVSQYESSCIAEEFCRRGYELCGFDEECDLYVINTCTVTAESDRKSRQMIRRAIKKNPNAIVAVCGCYSQVSADEVAAIEGVSIVIGTKDKLRLVGLVDEVKRRRSLGDFSPLVRVDSLEGAEFEKMCITRAPRTRAYVKIEDGCAYMLSANCPDKLCIRQGKAKDSSKKIICLPNRVTVEVTKKSEIDEVVR